MKYTVQVLHKFVYSSILFFSIPFMRSFESHHVRVSIYEYVGLLAQARIPPFNRMKFVELTTRLFRFSLWMCVHER